MTQVRRDDASPRREPSTQVIIALVAMVEERDAKIDALLERDAIRQTDYERLQEQLADTKERLAMTEEAWRSYREHFEDEARRR